MKLSVVNPQIGADIEWFLKNQITNQICSAEGIIMGSKNNPYNYDPENKWFSTSLDNVMAEGTIPPTTNCSEFDAYITKCINYINSIATPHGLCSVAIPSAILDDQFLNTENSQLFGCEPDYNVWLRKPNPTPKATNKNLRSTGFHVHIGHDNPKNLEVNEALIKTMDYYLGVGAILLEPDNERRMLYGKAGAFRFKDYGIEYRVLSGYFSANEHLRKWVFNNTMAAINAVNNGFDPNVNGAKVQEAINTANKLMCEEIVKEYNIELV